MEKKTQNRFYYDIKNTAGVKGKTPAKCVLKYYKGRKAMNMTKTELTNAEVLVMKCIWDTPTDMVLSEIVTLVNGRYGREWRPQTVSTYLAHLVQKQFLKMTRQGKIYTYHPLISEKTYRSREMRRFVEFWGSGSAADFLAAYKEDCGLSAEEADEIRALLDHQESA